MAKRKLPVPIEHASMISAITNLPDFSVLLWTNPQKSAIENRKEYWRLIGERIDYFQLKLCGFNPPDPLEERKLHPGWEEFIKLVSLYDFATLNLMIDQFETIKAAAVKEGRNFPFDDARELFAQRCRELANSEVAEEVSARGVNQGGTLTQQRVGLTKINALFKGRLPEEEESSILADFRTHKEWCVFWLFPVWQAVLESTPTKNLQRCWEDYLDAFKSLLQLLKKESDIVQDAKLLRPKWSAGHIFDPKTGRPLIYQPLYIS